MIINNRLINFDQPTYIIAELSCNHNQSYEIALDLLHRAHQAGADAVKLQTYRPDTITLDCQNEEFKIKGTIWENQNLYQLYQKTYTPWEWVPLLMKEAKQLGIDLFSSPFDITAVDYLEKCQVPAYKIASFEIVDHPLLKRIAQTGKPIIMSTGMASMSDISEAINVLKDNGANEIALLKCTSAYPSLPKDANLKTIPHLANTFQCLVGLSDHTLNIEIPIVAVALGARIVEKHFTLSRDSGSEDDSFSLTPTEFQQMVSAIRIAEQSLGKINYGQLSSEQNTSLLRRSIFVVKDINAGEELTNDNIKSIRPGHGLHPKYYDVVIGKKARFELKKGIPLNWSHID